MSPNSMAEPIKPSWPSSSRPNTPVKVSGLLDAACIKRFDAAQGKDEILKSLVSLLCDREHLASVPEVLSKVLDRERGISTTLDSGLSLPHTRLRALSKISLALAVFSHPIEDSKTPGVPVKAMLLVLVPENAESAAAYLKLLRSIANLFQGSLLEAIGRAEAAASVLELIRKAER